jgi:hypothetical protein
MPGRGSLVASGRRSLPGRGSPVAPGRRPPAVRANPGTDGTRPPPGREAPEDPECGIPWAEKPRDAWKAASSGAGRPRDARKTASAGAGKLIHWWHVSLAVKTFIPSYREVARFNLVAVESNLVFCGGVINNSGGAFQGARSRPWDGPATKRDGSRGDLPPGRGRRGRQLLCRAWTPCFGGGFGSIRLASATSGRLWWLQG